MDKRFLIIDTSHRQGLIALASANQVLSSRRLEEARRHARDLAPLAHELLSKKNWSIRDLTGVIVSRGPGSYTGLRVGLISAKTLAYATGCALLGIDTFAAIARQAPASSSIDVIADAQQGKIYVERFTNGQRGHLEIMPVSLWLADLPADTYVTGPALEIIGTQLSSTIRQAPPGEWLPRAQSLLELAAERQARGEKDDPFTLEPIYLRPSAAEEKFRRRS